MLVEGRVEDAREQFPEMTDEDFDYLVHNQPPGSNNKYLMWSCIQADELLENDPDRQALTMVMQAVRLFDVNKQRLEKKDLNQYKTTADVEAAVQALGGESKGQVAKRARADSDVIYNDDSFIVIRPHTTEASCKYGAGTKWCISATASTNYYNSYSTNNNKFYFVIDKSPTNKSSSSKFAVVMVDPATTGGDRIQVFDASDAQVGLATVAKHVGDKWPAIWAKIQEHVRRFPITREVEEARKETEVLVKDFLEGKEIADASITKIADKAKLTTPLINALVKRTIEKGAGTEYYSPVSRLANRATELTPEGALTIINNFDAMRMEAYHRATFYRNAPLTPETLIDLARNASEDALASIIANPNTPSSVLSELVEKVESIRNTELKRSIYSKLISTGEITEEQFKDAAKDYSIKYNLLRQSDFSANINPEFLRFVPITNEQELKMMLALPNITPALSAELLTNNWHQLPKHALYDTLKKINLPVDVIEKLWADNNNPHMRTSILQNPSIGEENVKRFARSKNSAFRFAIAHNPMTGPEELEELANDTSASTRSAVAVHPNSPPTLLRKLAGDEATIVRANVAANKATPLPILALLRKDSDTNVRKTASNTVKSLTRTETILREGIMRSLLKEEMTDDEDRDIMNPSWRRIPTRDTKAADFICVYLLQNNGHATREEIEDAYQTWHGKAGTKKLWNQDRWNPEVIRGATAGGAGWYWAPPGINAGAMFRLTPAGASVAMQILNKFHSYDVALTSVNSARARSGQHYYIAYVSQALDITGYEKGELSVERVIGDRRGNPVMVNGKPTRSSRNRDNPVKIYKYTNESGETKYITELPIVHLQPNTRVLYVKPFIGMVGRGNFGSDSNMAIVKHGDQTLITPFPLWVNEEGAGGELEGPEVAPPVRKSPPNRELNPNAAVTTTAAPARTAAAPAAPRGPKTTYKIYGRHKGRPVHTRLKGQAYAGAVGTQFAPGEQAVLSPEDGKLRVKKAQGDHDQLWDPIDG